MEAASNWTFNTAATNKAQRPDDCHYSKKKNNNLQLVYNTMLLQNTKWLCRQMSVIKFQYLLPKGKIKQQIIIAGYFLIPCTETQ